MLRLTGRTNWEQLNLRQSMDKLTLLPRWQRTLTLIQLMSGFSWHRCVWWPFVMLLIHSNSCWSGQWQEMDPITAMIGNQVRISRSFLGVFLQKRWAGHRIKHQTSEYESNDAQESVCGSTLLQDFSWCGKRSAVALLIQHGSVWLCLLSHFIVIVFDIVVVIGNCCCLASPAQVWILSIKVESNDKSDNQTFFTYHQNVAREKAFF